MKRHTLVVFLTLLALGSPSIVRSYSTDSFFLIIIDGLRNQEAFEDSTHAYIPHIWNDLRPLGTMYTDFYTIVIPGTTPGHQTLLSGARTDMINNHRMELAHFRSRYPTIFEYFRKQTGIPADSVWTVTGKRNLSTTNYSIHPAWGEAFGAIHMGDAGHDTLTYEAAVEVIDTYHPRMMMFNIKDTDVRGHVGTFEEYTTAIQIADSLVFELYNHIESDEFYSGTTTYFFTTDHGRIDDLHGGYHHHGLGTHGDRNCYFLAIGPDIRTGHVVEEMRNFTDVAPTVGELMGFQTPFAEGEVMWSMFAAPANEKRSSSAEVMKLYDDPAGNVSNSSVASTYPSIAVTADFTNLVWSERDTSSASENWRILYVRSDDGGLTWSDPVVIFENSQEDGTAYRGDISKGENAGLIATVTGYYGYTDQLDKRTYKWFAGYSTSSDGSLWTTPVILSNYSDAWHNIILDPPRAVLDSLEMQLGWVTSSWFTAKQGYDGTNDLSTLFDYRQQKEIPNEYLSSPDVVMDASRSYFAGERNNIFGSEIFCLPYDRQTEALTVLARIDPDSSGSFRPSMGVGNDIVHIVWADLTAGYKGIYYRRSFDRGATFSTPVLISDTGVDSWNPDMSVVDNNVVVVWEDYRDGMGEIYSRWSSDSGSSWGAVNRETQTAGFSVHPRVDGYGDSVFLTWQDMTGGSWDVFVTPLQIAPR